MRTDTVEIPTVRLCGWCKIKLSAIPGDPAVYRGWLVHPCCAQAAAAEDAYNQTNAYPEAELATV